MRQRNRDQIANFCWIIEKAREFHKFCFSDFTKAFDSVDHRKLWKILKEMGVQDYLTCLLRNLYVGQEATVSRKHGPADWFKIRKGVQQGWILSPHLLTLYAKYIKWNVELDESQAGIKIARRINNLKYVDDTTLMAESRESKESLDEGEKGEWKGAWNSKFKEL